RRHYRRRRKLVPNAASSKIPDLVFYQVPRLNDTSRNYDSLRAKSDDQIRNPDAEIIGRFLYGGDRLFFTAFGERDKVVDVYRRRGRAVSLGVAPDYRFFGSVRLPAVAPTAR